MCIKQPDAHGWRKIGFVRDENRQVIWVEIVRALCGNFSIHLTGPTATVAPLTYDVLDMCGDQCMHRTISELLEEKPDAGQD